MEISVKVVGFTAKHSKSVNNSKLVEISLQGFAKKLEKYWRSALVLESKCRKQTK